MKHMWKIISLLAVLLLINILSLRAQDVTPQSTQKAQVPVVVNVPAPPQNDVLATIAGLAVAFLSGVGITLVAVSGFVRGVMNDPVKMMLAERLGNSIPVELGRSMADSLGEIASFVRKATDHVPETDKPAETVASTNPMFTTTPAANAPLDSM